MAARRIPHQDVTQKVMFQNVIAEVLKSFDLQPLQYQASARVAISVCEAEDIQDMLRTFRDPGDLGHVVAFSDDQWRRLRSTARKKLVQIGAPDPIIEIVLERIRNISFEVLKWIVYHAEDTGIYYSSTYCWTPRFTIDYVKTAEMLSENDALDIKRRFKLACVYCLESKVRSLWRTMSLSERRFFFVRGNLQKSNQDLIVLYWTYHIQEVPMDVWNSKSLTLTELYKYSVTSGYLSATKFFLNKLKGKRRNQMISNSFSVHLRNHYKSVHIVKDHLAIACFLICQMPSVPITMVFDHTLSWVFRYFLEWPWQNHFMTVVNQLRDYMLEVLFVQLLSAIFEKEMEGFRDYDYKEIFKEFWRQGSEECKTCVKMNSRIGSKMLLRFVMKHFGFVFEEQSFTLKRKFRNIVLQQNASENAPNFEQENVEFFKFLVIEQVTTKASVQNIPQRGLNYLFTELGEYVNLPENVGELTFLMDGLLETE